MSYILDALKKADAQRERDPARGIHAQPIGAPTPGRPGAGDSSWFWGASAIAVVALSAAAWYVVQDRPSVRTPPQQPGQVPRPPVNVAAPPTVPLAVPPAASPTPDTRPSPEAVASAVLPPPAVPIEPAGETRTTSQPTARGRPQPAPAAAAARTTPPAASVASATAASAPASASSPARAAAPVARAVAPVAPVVQPPVISGGLPPDAPKLAFSGAVYSSNPAQRMLIVNGQVVNEGADLGAGVVLEEIKPKAAVIRYRGARYSVGF